MSAQRVLMAGLAAWALLAGTARAQDAAAEYRANWLEAQSALAAFADAPLAQARKQLDRPQLVAAYGRESERYAKALAALGGKLPPPQAAAAHWRMLPLHERALSATRLVRDAAERGDEAALAASWLALGDAIEALRRTLRELAR